MATIVSPEPFDNESSFDYIERVIAANSDVSCEALAKHIGVSLDTIHACVDMDDPISPDAWAESAWDDAQMARHDDIPF
tara:strand:+ start:405 stop:641 length:237 start_codon:yes stop_codon:yes gene_type:complete